MAATFHFAMETPPDSMFSEIQTLNKFNEEQFKQIVTIVLTFLLEPAKSSQLVVHLDDFARDEGISAAPLRNIVRSLITILNNAVKRNMTPSQLNEDLVNLGLSEEKSSYLSDQWKSNLLGLSRTAVGQTLMVNQLMDMEWKFGVTAASSELQQVGSTFLQLKLVVNKGNKTENVFMELSVPQFYSFLHEMEKAKMSLEYFS
ncbi:COMM domain-containing protein 7-like isoform X1 [Asterias rubens]|uniref:COMM domain-containing protein 7-like isoform X1 n=1 Tax=Asterias rubens TaxID=7604 RepID=UPI001454F93D|nr:COMM domain-containing protein 7-like isoform X1 [Asterias rubens]